MAAAVEEIVRSTKNCVLVCTNSNAAADEIAMRLLRVLQKSEIYRLYAKSHSEKNVNNELKSCSNFVKGQFHIPSLKYLYKFRVIVCTLLTAGCLSRAREDHDFSPSHFSHVIIDECASSNETATLVPIAGIFYYLSPSLSPSIKRTK